MDASWAEELAERLLAEALPNRWAHSRGVGRKAHKLRTLAGEHADVLEAAAFLHDIGYAPTVRDTGFHPLDGARYLRDHTDAPALLCTLVANHTCALIEAAERGLDDALAREFPIGEEPEGTLVAAITHCDLSVGPTGLAMTAEARVEEILSRYRPGDPVHRAIERARPTLLEQYDRIVTLREVLDPLPGRGGRRPEGAPTAGAFLR
jgi:hypothetical protein